MSGLEFVIAAVVIAVLAGTARRMSQPADRPKTANWLIRTWNASGARELQGTTFGDAVTGLSGRAIGSALRGGKRSAIWTGRKGILPAAKAGGRIAAWTVSTTFVAPAKKTARVTARLRRSAMRRMGRRWDAKAADREPRLFRRRERPAGRAGTSGRMSRVRGWLHRHRPWRRAGTPPDTPPTVAPAAPVVPPAPPTRLLRLAPPPTSGEAMTTPDTTSQPAAAPTASNGLPLPPPPDWQMLIRRVGNLEPGSDIALERFMLGEMTGMIAYAEALKNVHGTCVGALGLDPASVQGIADYAMAAGDAGAAMAGAHKRWRAVYEEILRAVRSGVIMPFKGRFFTTGRAG
ncbi:hypothetical protein FXF51_06300 [Nonomuraea sp. PA05]|uniref:hypothetical protein n=1 Tax=Nonomuraea sp. PA05 TaxID=2604466 RepID=UPI0011D5A19A|nr:hypothetical protein [Nonomuraea sp. PA05]TYB69772.1 hypothetical protein FXF51_06300 [Nonomuraea sp. PA05]